MELGRFVYVMQSKRKWKVHLLSWGLEDSSRNIALGSRDFRLLLWSVQMWIVIPEKLVCVSLTRVVWPSFCWLKPVILIVRLSMGQPHEDWNIPHHSWLLKTLHPALKNNKHSPVTNSSKFPTQPHRKTPLSQVYQRADEKYSIQWPSWEFSLDTILPGTSLTNFLYLPLLCKQLWAPAVLLGTSSKDFFLSNKACGNVRSSLCAAFCLRSLSPHLSLHVFQSNMTFFWLTIGTREAEIKMIADWIHLGKFMIPYHENTK
jgi:hypothetical protein